MVVAFRIGVKKVLQNRLPCRVFAVWTGSQTSAMVKNPNAANSLLCKWQQVPGGFAALF
jgi:hypothetical protein